MFESAFYFLFALLFGTLLLMYRQALRRAGRSPEYIRQNTITVVAVMTAWILYVTLLSCAGIFRIFAPPPRILLLIILPAFAWMIWYFRSGRYRVWMQYLPVWQLPALQIFRIAVELLLWGIALRNLAPELLTFEGRNFDMVAGATGPIMAWLLYRYGFRFYKLTVYWNFMGLALLVNVVSLFITVALSPQIWGFTEIPLKPEFGAMPYMLVPAVFMPAAVFMHILSLHQTAISRTKAREETRFVPE